MLNLPLEFGKSDVITIRGEFISSQQNEIKLYPPHIPGARLEVDDFELGVGDGAAAGEEPRVGRSATVLAPLTNFTETQIVQVPANKI